MPKPRKEIEVPKDWQAFGWQGFQVRVPRDWTPASLTGAREEGYVRLDGPDQPRLEIKWATSRGFVDVEKVVSRYLRSLSKGHAGKEVRIDEHPKLRLRMPKERSSVHYFAWHGDQKALGAAWYCRDCGRTMLIQVLGPVGEDLVPLTEQLLSTFEDHPTGNWALWSLYEFSCQVPSHYQLARQELLTGLLRLDFERGREKLAVVRWGMAGMALQGTDLKSWLRQKNQKSWRQFRVDLAPSQVHGHEQALALSGISAAPLAHMGSVALRLVGRKWPNCLRGAAWLCEPTNRIYHVEAVVDPSDEEMVAEVIERIVCHEGAERAHET
ncbi:MAG: hypothetical protein AB7W28_11050 [Armatimonadota bacterium]